MKRDGGMTPPKNGKGGGGESVLIIFPKSVMGICFYPKFPRVGNGSPSGLNIPLKGDKCQVEGMQYILMALVYFGGNYDYYYIFLSMLQALMSREESDCMENTIITLFA
jgi:hypothetical protein